MFLPLGYMAKRLMRWPSMYEPRDIRVIASVSPCMSKDFANFIDAWKHNDRWFFDDLKTIEEVATEKGISLKDTALFFYQVHELEYDEERETWSPFTWAPLGQSATPPPTPPPHLGEGGFTLLGYDLVTFSFGNNPEHSPLSCNGIAQEITVNEYCLSSTFDDAVKCLESGRFKLSEPGPFRIIAVYGDPRCIDGPFHEPAVQPPMT